MKIKLAQYELEMDQDCKNIADGWEIFPSAVNELHISPTDFTRAEQTTDDSIIVREE